MEISKEEVDQLVQTVAFNMAQDMMYACAKQFGKAEHEIFPPQPIIRTVRQMQDAPAIQDYMFSENYIVSNDSTKCPSCNGRGGNGFSGVRAGKCPRCGK